MPDSANVVTVATTAAKLRDGVLDLTNVESGTGEGCQVFTHYNGPTDQLGGICAGHGDSSAGREPASPAPASRRRIPDRQRWHRRNRMRWKNHSGRSRRHHVLRREYFARDHEHRQNTDDFLLV